MKKPCWWSKVLDHQYLLDSTPDQQRLNVTLRITPKKGVGLFATNPIRKGDIIALYKAKVYKYGVYHSETKWRYTIGVYDRRMYGIRSLIADVFDGSVPQPLNDVPYWAHFANEPSVGESSNAELDVNTKYNYRDRKAIVPGDTVLYDLKATKYISPGEEIMWHYGTNYKRDYPVEPVVRKKIPQIRRNILLKS